MTLTASHIGDKIVRNSQVYTCVGLIDHQCKDGRLTKLSVYQSPCATYGTLFEFTGPQYLGPQPFTRRRCDRHKKPGTAIANAMYLARRNRRLSGTT